MKITCYFTRENNMLFSEVKRMISQLRWLHNPLKSTLMCSCMIKTSSVLPRKSSASSEFFGNVWKRLSGLPTTFGESSEVFGKCSEIFGKSSKKSSLLCYISLVRYQVEHSKRNSILTRNHVLSSISLV